MERMAKSVRGNVRDGCGIGERDLRTRNQEISYCTHTIITLNSKQQVIICNTKEQETKIKEPKPGVKTEDL